MSKSDSHPSGGLWDRLHKFAFISASVYAVLIALLASPVIQRHAAYQHSIRIPWYANFDYPEKYGLSPGKTMNFKLTTSDNVTIGAWFVLSDSFYQAHRARFSVPLEQPSLEVVHAAMRANPTILYLHGAAATRATPARVQTYSTFTSRLHANVMTIDYRGFGESEGVPSEDGLAEDAETAWRWLIDQGIKPEDIMLVGHSLGTGVTTKLATALARENIKPRGVALLAPFTSLATLTETYSVLGVPVLHPLQSFPIGRRLIKRLLRHEFDTLSVIRDINVPVLLAHSQNDQDIPHTHSRTLLDQLLDPHLPAAIALPMSPGGPLSSEEYAAYIQAQEKRHEARSELVRKVELPSFGAIEEFDGSAGKVVYVETFWGKHNEVGLQEGVQDIIASTFGLGAHV